MALVSGAATSTGICPTKETEGTMTLKRPTHEELLAGKVNVRSWINEPIDFFVEPEVIEPMSALERARRRWGMKEPEPK
jgi:hypothetical protein